MKKVLYKYGVYNNIKWNEFLLVSDGPKIKQNFTVQNTNITIHVSTTSESVNIYLNYKNHNVIIKK